MKTLLNVKLIYCECALNIENPSNEQAAKKKKKRKKKGYLHILMHFLWIATNFKAKQKSAIANFNFAL